jgi:hypothetical protein
MDCFLCGKKIGFFRSLSDQQYCCAAHRQEARLASARALREEEDQETWAVARSRKKNRSSARAASSAAEQAGLVLVCLGVGGVMLAVFAMGGSRSSPVAAFPAVSIDPGKNPGFFERAGGAVSNFVRGVAPVTLRQSFPAGGFRANLADWANVSLQASAPRIDDPRDWIGRPKSNVSLRLWKKSTSMQNYQMEFLGQLEKTSLSWAVRASSDGGNYYATKLAIIKGTPTMNAGLIRYAVINGREEERTQVPLPLTLERGAHYHVRVTVQDDRFLTFVNGKVVGSMTDKRLVRGGVGFFDDAADPQKIAWVSISERDSFLGRLLAHFALFVMPPLP